MPFSVLGYDAGNSARWDPGDAAGFSGMQRADDDATGSATRDEARVSRPLPVLPHEASVAQPQSRGGGAPSEEEVRAVVKRCVASLETQGTRKVALQPFLQAMLDLNAQLGRATDLQQLQALFDAAKSEKDGMIDLRKFLSNPRAVSYFVNAPAQG